MPILNRSKIRPDIMKLLDDNLKIQTKGVFEFLSLKENKGVNFPALLKKINDGNELMFKGLSNKDETILEKYMTEEELLFLAKMFRCSGEYLAKINQEKYPIPKDVKLEKIEADGVPAEWQIVPGAAKERVLLYFHGGGMIFGSPNQHRLFTIALGQATKMRVLSVDYRLAPENPYPASTEDCFTAYKWLLSTGIKPDDIIIGGDSAGGTLTLTTLVKARDNGLSLPGGAFCLSPLIDFILTSGTVLKNAETDPVLADIGLFMMRPAYLAGAEPNNPLISPLYADLKGLPPLLIQVSEIEMLYDHSTRLFERAKAAGVDVKIETWADTIHVFQSSGLHDLPESKEAISKISEFIKKQFN